MSEQGKKRRMEFYASRVARGLSVPKQVTVKVEEPPKPTPKPKPKKEEEKKDGN